MIIIQSSALSGNDDYLHMMHALGSLPDVYSKEDSFSGSSSRETSYDTSYSSVMHAHTEVQRIKYPAAHERRAKTYSRAGPYQHFPASSGYLVLDLFSDSVSFSIKNCPLHM